MIRPYGGMVLVEQEQADERSPGGIIIPDDAKKKPCRGKVLAVGGGRVQDDGVFREIPLRAGERVLWDKMGAHEVPDAPALRLVSAEYVLGVLE